MDAVHALQVGDADVVLLRDREQALARRDIAYQVRRAWHEWLYLRQAVKELEEQLSFYEDFEDRADLQYRLGERSLLEKTLIENSLYELRNNYILRAEDLNQAVATLQFLMEKHQVIHPRTMEARNDFIRLLRAEGRL